MVLYAMYRGNIKTNLGDENPPSAVQLSSQKTVVEVKKVLESAETVIDVPKDDGMGCQEMVKKVSESVEMAIVVPKDGGTGCQPDAVKVICHLNENGGAGYLTTAKPYDDALLPPA
ncbi:hypothetical protein U1Q18_007023 [Sarracenia purpurea var. burkii]